MNTIVLRFAGLLSVLAIVLFFTEGAGQRPGAAVFLVTCFPSLVVLLWPPRLFHIARGIAIGQAGFACPWLLLFTFLGFSGFAEKGAGTTMPIILCSQLLLGVAGLYAKDPNAPIRRGDQPLLVCGLIFGLFFAPFTVWRYEHSQNQINPDSATRLIASLESYGVAHGGHFPATLHDLLAAEGPNSLYHFMENGSSDNDSGEVRYLPTTSRDGQVTGFSLLLGHARFWGAFQRDGYTDKSAIIHFTLEPHGQDAILPVPYNPSVPLHDWLNCIVNYAKTATSPAPEDFQALRRPAGPCSVVGIEEGKFFELTSGYLLEYHKDAPAAGRPSFAFHVDVRPRGYGATGVRSYYADESGVIRGTPEDRKATRDDPLIPECEWHEHTLCPATL